MNSHEVVEPAPRFGPGDELLRRTDLESFFRCGKTKSYELTGSADFPAAVRIGGIRYWLKSDLLAFVRRRELEQRAAAPASAP